MLAFDSVSETGELRLESSRGDVLFAQALSGGHGSERADLLGTIAEALETAGIRPAEIASLIVCRGPGRFTAVRTACVIANAFAASQQVALYPLDHAEYHSGARSLAELISRFADRRTYRAEPYFDSPPRITPSA